MSQSGREVAIAGPTLQRGGCACGGCALLVLGVGLYLILALGQGFGVFLAVLGGIGVLISIYMIAAMVQKATIDCTLTADKSPLRFRDSLTVTVRLEALKRCTPTTGNLRLHCGERAINRGGTSDTTYTHTVYEELRPVEVQQTLEPGGTWSTSATFRVPEGYPASFSGANNFIEWTVRLDLGLRGPLLDLHETLALDVLPERA